MRVLITGSSLAYYSLARYVEKFQNKHGLITEIIIRKEKRDLGMIAKMLGERKGIPVKEMLPDWDRYGKKASLINDRTIAAYADAVIAIWNSPYIDETENIKKEFKRQKKIIFKFVTRTRGPRLPEPPNVPLTRMQSRRVRGEIIFPRGYAPDGRPIQMVPAMQEILNRPVMTVEQWMDGPVQVVNNWTEERITAEDFGLL